MNRLRLGVVGLSEGNGHPYSWSAIINGYDSEAMAECPFTAIPAYLAERSFPRDQLTDAEVTHVWTQAPAVSAHIARAAKIPHVVTELSGMLSEIDALLLARDDAEHHSELGAAFLRAGLPVYIDKPPALSVAELDELYALAVRPEQIFSCSALRFAEELRLTAAEKTRLGPLRRITGVTPKSWERYAAHLLDPVLSFLEPGPVEEHEALVEGGRVRLKVRWASGLLGEFEATGRPEGDIALHYVGEQASIRKVFVDSFSAFRCALRHFVAGARAGSSATGYGHVRELVSLLELGSRTAGAGARRSAVASQGMSPQYIRDATRTGG